MALDTLEVFGTEYTGVAGFKATDDNDQVKTYIRPQGTLSITANSTGIDVSTYALADVAVAATDFVITLSYSSQQEKWIPDKTFSAIYDSQVAGKTLVAKTDEQPTQADADCIYFNDGGLDDDWMEYNVRERYTSGGITYIKDSRYVYNSSGLTLAEAIEYPKPTGSITIDDDGTWDVTTVASAVVPAGTAGTPTASKGTVTNHAVSVTPSVTNSTGWITGGTKTGTAVSVAASELVSGNLSLTANTTNADCSNYATVTVNVSGGGVSYDTKTATASQYPVSLEFTSMKGRPKFFVVRLNAQVSSSGSTTYYYIVDIASDGTTTHGNCFRIGSTRRVDNITSGYSWTYSGTTLTITSSAASRSASPGAFYSGSYELMYAY